MDATIPSYPVYVGVWTNWDHGRVLGSTLTLPRSDGSLLIAFIAFFVTIISTQLWRILCFALHSSLSSDSLQDALHHQRQVVLRNSTSPLSSIWLLTQMMHAWSSRPRPKQQDKKHQHVEARARPLRRLLPLVLASLLVAVALAAATGLSSRIALEGNEVLVDGTGCGRLRFATADNATAASASLLLGAPYRTRAITKAADYAQRCYASLSAPAAGSTFMHSALPITRTSNASCPFVDDSMCLSQDDNVILDSGLVDSFSDLGLNSPPEDRFQLQRRLHCAPLVTEAFRSNYSYEGRSFVRYQYGHVDSERPDSDCNCTLAVPSTALADVASARTSPFLEPGADFRFITMSADFLNGTPMNSSEGHLIPQLSHLQGDLSLIFLMGNSMAFANPSQDMWYRASTLAKTGEEDSVRVYTPDEPAWPMGCVTQHQFCQRGRCTGLGSYMDTVAHMSSDDDFQVDSSFFGPSFYVSMVESVSNIVSNLGARALSGTRKGAGALQVGPSSSSEWHQDVTHWFATMLTDMQFQLAIVAAGPDLTGFPGLQDYVEAPPVNETQRFCHSQKIRSTAYTSFSLFWLLLVFTFGLLIVLLSANLEAIATFTQRWLFPKSTSASTSNGYACLEWRANHALHLQRLAHEQQDADQRSSHEWVQGSWDIPVTAVDVKLASVKGNEGLPRLVGSRDEDEEDGRGDDDAAAQQWYWSYGEAGPVKARQSHIWADRSRFSVSDDTLS